jgi:CRISPR-associated protein Cmr6
MKSRRKGDRESSKTLLEVWQEFIQAELKQNSKVGQAFEKASFAGLENKVLTVYFEDETAAKTAKGQIEPLKKKLPPELRPCDRVEVKVGKVSQPAQVPQEPSKKKGGSRNFSGVSTPLQTLCLEYVDIHTQESAKSLLEAAKTVETHCQSIYDRLKQRTESLVAEGGVAFPVSFGWRLRVGGTRGFLELLLPVFHPVFGVPYIPSSSLKGAARAWARQHGESKSEVSKILGILDGKVAQAAKVEFLDAFPTKKSLIVDVATPQWHWQDKEVVYKPEPHPLLSMERPQFLIGLRPTKPENAKYIPIVKEWLENALKSGIGSRVSSGYGRALGQSSTLPYSRTYNFELWTQGMYGSEPPSRQNDWKGEIEFRPTAIRGILRYWFRAFALSLYEPSICQTLEDTIFGKLSQQGKISISVVYNPRKRKDLHWYDGKIYLEATEEKYLNLLDQLLVLASHLGGVGRGSRRPLHSLDVNGLKRRRGCHWTVDAEATPLEYNLEAWKQLFTQIKTAFTAVQSPTISRNSSPGGRGGRQQDVLDANAQVWLVKSPHQISPDQVSDWDKEGLKENVRGEALSLFYSDDRFKGKNTTGRGNPSVGGELGTPSFVWIKSVFPRVGNPYQVVTIFGVEQSDSPDQPNRLTFAKELNTLAKKNPPEAILVFGTMPTGNTPQQNRPIRRR